MAFVIIYHVFSWDNKILDVRVLLRRCLHTITLLPAHP
jgi:hypothetical protein